MIYSLVGFLATSFVGLTYVAHVLEGSMIDSTDVAMLNQVGISQVVHLGFLSIPVPGLNFVQGIIQMGSFDYSSIFTGNAQLLLFVVYSITFVVMFAMFLTVIGLGVNAIRTH